MNIKTQNFLVHLILLAIPLYLISCDNFTSRETLAYREMNVFARKIKKSDDCTISGTGGCFQDGKIKEFSMYFIKNDLLTLDKARRFHFKLICDFANQVNSHNKILAYLPEQFCSYSTIHIHLGILDENYEPPPLPYIWAVFKKTDNTILYVGYDKENNKRPIIAEEPLEEALESLKQSDKELYQKFITTFKITPNLE